MLSPAPGVIIQNKYLLEAPLARGGMGSVWIATHRELAVRVAVKFMAPELAASDGGGARFEREAKAAAHLDSRHIVQIRDYGVADGTPFLVMELLKGESLEQRLARLHRVSLLDALAILHQLAKGLRKAHEVGIIHRDLKPGNIFIARTDDEDVVKLLDFGIAKLSNMAPDANATRTGMVMGSVHYASPEQLRSSKDADVRSDLWSVGVILFRMLVGGLPFRGHEIADVIVKVCAEPIPTPRSMAPDLPPEVDAFFCRALVRNPAERFQTIAELVDAFAALVEHARGPALHAPVVVPPPAPVLVMPPPVTPDLVTPPPVTPPPAMSSAPRAVTPDTLRIPDSEAEAKTALWTAARIPPLVPSGAPDHTLRGASATSVTTHPSASPQRSRHLAIGLAAVSVTVLAGVTVSALLLSPGQAGVSAASSSAPPEMAPPEPSQVNPHAAVSAGEVPAPEPAMSSASAAVPVVPLVARGAASTAAPPEPPAGAGTIVPPVPSPSASPSAAKPAPSPKKPLSKSSDRDVDMP